MARPDLVADRLGGAARRGNAAGRPAMTGSDADRTVEKRRHPRVSREERLFVQIVSSQEAADLVGRTFRASTHDVSAGGLRLQFDAPAPPGSTLDLWVKADGNDGTFLLRGEIRWVAPIEDGDGFEAGVALSGLAAVDTERWQAFVAAALLEQVPG